MTDAGLVLAILGVTFGLALMMYLGGRKPRRRRAAEREPGFDPKDLTELSGRLSTLATAHGPGDITELTRQLQRLSDARCPVHSIIAAPSREAVRIRFAGGTTVLVRGEVEKLVWLARQRGQHPVRLYACRTGPAGTELVLDYRNGQLTTGLVGIDQAD